MKTRIIKRVVGLAIIAAVLPFGFAHAQFATDPNAQSVLVTSTPDSPQPGDTVSFKVTSYLSDLDTASITWYVNGRKVSSGTGLRTFSTQLGAVGTKTTVKVIVRTQEGNTITQTMPFSSVNVDLLWEAQSYTPPFYEGKALFTPKESVRVVAVPHLSRSTASLSPTNLIYTWSKDGRVLGDASGYGRNTLDLDASATYKSTDISVTVTSKDTSINATKSITLDPSAPVLITYAASPALGTLYNIALQGDMKLSTKELNIAAVPYFFNTANPAYPNVLYSWDINGSPVQNNANNSLTVRNDATTTGTTQISATANAPVANTNQSADTSFNLHF